MRSFLIELTSGAAAGKDFTVTDAAPEPAVLPDWFEFLADGTLVFVDGDGVSRTINGSAGQKYPVELRSITTSSGTIRVGKSSGAILPGPTGPTGAVGGDFTPTALLTGTSNALVAGQLALADPSGGVVTVTLPTAVGISGKRIAVKDATGAAATHNITVARTSAQTIDGAASNTTISTNSKCIIFVSDGANWYVVSAS